jgi:TPR repeat protein
LSIVQNALSVIKDQKYKWFWFATQDAGIAWQSDSFRKELTYDGMEFGSYDLFLANYVYALIFDPEFKKASLWKPVFTCYIYICNDSSQKLIKSRFNEKELNEIKVLDAVRSFKTEIFKPMEELCEIQDAKSILRLYKIVCEFSDDTITYLAKTVMTRLTKWFTSREEVVCALINKCNDDNHISPSEARGIKKTGDTYIREVEKVLSDTLAAVKNVSVRYEMIKESYRHATWQLMFAFHKANDTDKAISYANKCYPYCDESDKRKIRNTFGFSAIKGADRDATQAEWDIMGDNYYEGKNGYEQDYYEAFKWYKKAAEAGNKYSQNSLGICYQEGNGTYQSDYEAAEWFEKAYENGNPDGAFNLAKCYASGDGRIQDKHKAIDLYLEAAKFGHPAAAEAGKSLIELMQLEQKLHRLSQHEHYDLGYQIPIGETIVVEVTLNYSANVYLMESDDYDNYRECENFSYYGGRATQSPYRIKIPNSGFWHLVIDNGDEDMTGIVTSVHTRTFNF